jgi:diguanylate cyclase (GGDEF)-like protein/PAS domain S-box-containing protein
MYRFMLPLLRTGLFALLLMHLAPACAQDTEVHIGVLSFRPIEQTREQWQPTADHLSATVPGYHFSIEPMFFDDLDRAISQHRFDFVLTNPEHYVTTRTNYGLAVIATLMPLAQGHPVSSFGGVIFARADRKDIESLDDVRGKIVAAAAEQSFGSYLMQRWVLYKHDIRVGDLGGVRFTGMPQDKVVKEVASGLADVGFVRTGILENMSREGKIELAQFKVLNRQPDSTFPQLLSTELYPEWAFSATPDTPDALIKAVNLSLLNIGPEDAAARTGKYYGFTPPGNYAPVEAVMVRLDMTPDQTQQFDWRDVVRKYAIPIFLSSVIVLAAILAALFFVLRTYRRLQQSYQERSRLDNELQEMNASLEISVAERTQQLQESEARFRRMFEGHSSPMLLIDPADGAIVNANQAAAEFYGYACEQMRLMNINRINTMSPAEIAKVLAQAAQNKRNYFVFQHRLASGDIRTVEVYASPVEVDSRRLMFTVIHDITERRELEEQMRELAYYDPLTRLPNRRLLLDHLRKAMSSCRRSGRHGALLFLDLDHFKTLNDLHGHDIGDLLLQEVAARLQHNTREQDSVARLGGDEFIILLEDLSGNLQEAMVQAEGVAEKVRSALAQPYLLKRHTTPGTEEIITHHCSSSIGVTLFLDHNETLEQLLKWTDMAMYRAKEAGRNAIRFFDPAMQRTIEQRAALEADLYEAIESDQLRLHYQVQIDAAGQPQGAEALLRWQHPQRGLVPPGEFIPVAEDTGLILPIGAWVVETACIQLKRWEEDADFDALTLAVNISAKQFRQTDFVDQVLAAIQRHDVRPELLKLELTESLALEDVEDTIAKMSALKRSGVSFSMDDFGTGYSSLSYLKRLPLSQLKIDQSFVRNLTTDKADQVMARTIIDLGFNFEMAVIAEGVETEAQRDLLGSYGCASFQGYLFSKPLPADLFEVWVRERRAQAA